MTRMSSTIADQPRARGRVVLSVHATPRGTEIANLRQSGALRLLFPRRQGTALRAVLTNTAGGITGGDDFGAEIAVGENARLNITTQAAERAYRAQPGQIGHVASRLQVAAGGHVDWLPQETILYDGFSLERKLTIDLAPGASALVVEPLVFGRMAMGETLTSGRLHDRIELRRDGRIAYLDRITLSGDIAAHLEKPAIAGGAAAVAVLIFVHPAAEARCEALRSLLPETAGASLISIDLLAARILASDGHDLRRTLIAAIRLLTDHDIPRPWMI